MLLESGPVVVQHSNNETIEISQPLSFPPFQYDEQQAQLSLADEEQRPVLKAAFMEFTELKKRFPQVDEASLGCEYVQR